MSLKTVYACTLPPAGKGPEVDFRDFLTPADLGGFSDFDSGGDVLYLSVLRETSPYRLRAASMEELELLSADGSQLDGWLVKRDRKTGLPVALQVEDVVAGGFTALACTMHILPTGEPTATSGGPVMPLLCYIHVLGERSGEHLEASIRYPFLLRLAAGQRFHDLPQSAAEPWSPQHAA